jgi:methylated-DNA-[protein]-cysteine S-methyltransferase
MHYCEISTPLCRLVLVGDEQGLRRISFQDTFRPARPAEGWRRAQAPFRDVILQLDAYFAGRLRRFDLPLAPEGTPFQREVWSALTTIPYGETVSYGELARRVGRPTACRAVGAANGRNPIPIIIPCHRVIGADGSLTGFGGGLPIKRRLLLLEAIDRRRDQSGFLSEGSEAGSLRLERRKPGGSESGVRANEVGPE